MKPVAMIAAPTRSCCHWPVPTLSAAASAGGRLAPLAGLDAGGGKTVVLDHDGLDRDAAYEALGRAIAGLDGEYVCGPDIGTGAAELLGRVGSVNAVEPLLKYRKGVLTSSDLKLAARDAISSIQARLGRDPTVGGLSMSADAVDGGELAVADAAEGGMAVAEEVQVSSRRRDQ